VSGARPLLVLVAAVVTLACQETPVSQPLRSLQRNGDVSFVCRGADGRGRPIDACPDFENGDNRLFAMVIQTQSGEVAVVDLSGGRVIDVNPSVPGFSFLPVGDVPGDIVSTPGGEATFVGAKRLGMEGIFGLPTSCIGPPKKDEPTRDLTLWPACSLPSAPGEMAILIDPPAADGTIRQSCSDPLPEMTPAAAEVSRDHCKVDLTRELVPPGRRKLAVALPDLSQIAIIDAQTILDRSPGSFEPCEVERWHSLEVELPPSPIAQRVPPDLEAPGCTLQPTPQGPPPESFRPKPSDFALAGDTLYVADQDAPVIHVLDVADPCAPAERPPLLPRSFDEPDRIVTTQRLAVSPLTPSRQRFLYATDDADLRLVMAFDVSPGSVDRTPLVRPGAPRLFEPPDRIGFASAVNDLAFVMRDIPIPDASGVAVFGARCDPDPSIAPESPLALYRPNSTLTRGAAPGKLRGVFGFALLSSGQIAVIDVDDFDAACRRPESTNPHAEEDFRGCTNDRRSGLSNGESVDESFVFRDSDDRLTVTNEVSCRIAQPHRVRSASFVLNSDDRGVRAPALRTFPKLGLGQGTLPTDPGEEGRKHPKLLGVGFESPESDATSGAAQVWVGTKLYVARVEGEEGGQDTELVIDPDVAERASLVLPLNEPRSYPAEEEMSLTYEGIFTNDLRSGVFTATVLDAGIGELADTEGRFCIGGVEDADLAAEVGATRFGLSGDALARFRERHADYVQLTSPLLAENEPYWKQGEGALCGGGGRAFCEDIFGAHDAEEVDESRDLLILEAYQDRLVFTPRELVTAEEKRERLELLRCCFPTHNTYRVRGGHQWMLRGSGFRHDVIAVRAEGNRCRRDCNPRLRHRKGRAYEVSCATEGGCVTVGLDPRSEVCKLDPDAIPVRPDNEGSECIFENLTARFVVYRGLEESERDMTFSWITVGGFRPLVANLTAETASVLPESMVFLDQIDRLVVSDGISQGLMLVSLDSIAISRLFF
jgi:hypothetical protein